MYVTIMGCHPSRRFLYRGPLLTTILTLVVSPPRPHPQRPLRPYCRTGLAVGETVILLHPPLPLVGVSIVMWRERQ